MDVCNSKLILFLNFQSIFLPIFGFIYTILQIQYIFSSEFLKIFPDVILFLHANNNLLPLPLPLTLIRHWHRFCLVTSTFTGTSATNKDTETGTNNEAEQTKTLHTFSNRNIRRRRDLSDPRISFLGAGRMETRSTRRQGRYAFASRRLEWERGRTQNELDSIN